ncbi:MAG: sulfotransferase [Candidatus Marinimicrobia bacterium]|nr:sulfotransferase [Candidatus Neomarinimicrobiota bacterium]
MKSTINRIRKLIQQNKNFVDPNLLYYTYRRYNNLFDIKRMIKNYDHVKIEHPIFMLGTQGNGNTLISRMIRRHPNIVSVTGNYKYWAGADEMNSVLGPILPEEFRSIEHIKPYPDNIIYPFDWVCGINRYYHNFRNEEKDFTIELQNKMNHIVKWLINKYQVNSNPRFIDKSQNYTLKMPLLERIFRKSKPKFILVTRNPYASCYRAANGNTYRKENFGLDLNLKIKIELACQHWKNYMETAIEDGSKVDNFLLIRFEDVLNFPEKKMNQICKFIGIDFSKDLLPQKDDVIPFGSKRTNRWYPLRPNVNKKYLMKIDTKEIEIINKNCGSLIEYLNYSSK